jgi:hypothetical protein
MPGASTGTASSTTLQIERMLKAFSPPYEKMRTSPAVAACQVHLHFAEDPARPAGRKGCTMPPRKACLTNIAEGALG